MNMCLAKHVGGKILRIKKLRNIHKGICPEVEYGIINCMLHGVSREFDS
jgi:hypothetical protein